MTDPAAPPASSTGPESRGLRVLLCSSLAGIFATACTHPIDTWVVHRAANLKLASTSVRHLFKGIVPAATSSAIIYGAMLGSYEYLQSGLGYSPTSAAMLAAFPEGMVKGPLEAIKNRMQTNTAVNLGAMARGTLSMIAREIPLNVLYFGTYSHFRGPSPLEQLTAGAAAGFVSCLVLYPLEALRVQWVVGAPLRFTFQGGAGFTLRGTMQTALLFGGYESLLRLTSVADVNL